jgi:8-oxo-dGTP diphosphatase
MFTNIKENINISASQILDEYKTAVSVDCVIFGFEDGILKVLVSKCDMHPFTNEVSLLGDIVSMEETTDEAAERVLAEKTGFDDVFLEQVKVFSAIDRHPLGRVITVAYYSLIKIDAKHKEHLLKDNHNAYWVCVNDIHKMAFDHLDIVKTCLSTIKRKLRNQPIGFHMLPEKFTFKEIQNLYETILGEELDKRNFRRKLTSLEILEDEGIDKNTNASHRPSRLYSFDFEKYSRKRAKGFLFNL